MCQEKQTGMALEDSEAYSHEYMHAHGVPHEHSHGHVHSHEHTRAVVNRLARAIGHLERVKAMVEEGGTVPRFSSSWPLCAAPSTTPARSSSRTTWSTALSRLWRTTTTPPSRSSTGPSSSL